MNFLETLICLALVSILASVSIFGYQHLITRTRINADTQIIKTSLSYARDRATRSVPSTVSCNAVQCQVHTVEGLKLFPLSGIHLISTQLFPANADNVFVFESTGMTAFHNGTILVMPHGKPELAKKVVVSQGGRIR